MLRQDIKQNGALSGVIHVCSGLVCDVRGSPEGIAISANSGASFTNVDVFGTTTGQIRVMLSLPKIATLKLLSASSGGTLTCLLDS
ncbi:MAG: hypothetical protein AAF944_26595 [Bacteroidota bacterium]